jgi:hypothetical protein
MRNVSYEDDFDEELRRLFPEFERADDFIRGVEEKLARNPRFGTQLQGTPVWFVPTIDILPKRYVIYYTFTDTHVRILEISPADEELSSGEF